MNYKIITNREILEDFIDDFLPELSQGQKFFCSLFARSKYVNDSQIRTNKTQLKRFISDKERLINKIEQMEVPLGVYKQFIKGEEPLTIPQESLALYINPNPRDLKKATFSLGKKIFDLLQMDSNFNIHQESLSQVQKSIGKKVYMDFDFDGVDIDLTVQQIKSNTFINFEACHFLKTRGGFHILVKISDIHKDFSKVWYNGIKSLDGVDIVGDNLIPVPGTFQGGFTPRLLKSL